ncbi:toprim domain-containing protein ['Prunus avium' virescence phytoplasma]|uniref:toprim domain-containing protein n=1 Tax='Prunus avium' virescence phytoplasma TaxID=2056121 RepID=UPI003D80198F
MKIIIALDNDKSGTANANRLKTQLNKNNIKNEIKKIHPRYLCKDADDILKKYDVKTYKKIFLENKGE